MAKQMNTNENAATQIMFNERDSAAREDLNAILEDWGAVYSDFDQIRMDASFEF